MMPPRIKRVRPGSIGNVGGLGVLPPPVRGMALIPRDVTFRVWVIARVAGRVTWAAATVTMARRVTLYGALAATGAGRKCLIGVFTVPGACGLTGLEPEAVAGALLGAAAVVGLDASAGGAITSGACGR